MGANFNLTFRLGHVKNACEVRLTKVHCDVSRRSRGKIGDLERWRESKQLYDFKE